MFPVLFHFGPITIYSYGVMIATGVALALLLMKKRERTLPFSANAAGDYVIIAVASGIVGARIWYAMLHWNEFQDHPLAIIEIWQGGLILYGGIIFACVGVWIAARLRQHHFVVVTDVLVPYLAMAQGFGRIGCFLNGCCYGLPSTGFLAVRFPFLEGPVMPVQLFEACFCFVLYFLLYHAYQRRRSDGTTTGLYFIVYPLGRFLLEYVRGDQIRIAGILTRPQLVSIAMLAAGCVLLAAAGKGKRHDGKQ